MRFSLSERFKRNAEISKKDSGYTLKDGRFVKFSDFVRGFHAGLNKAANDNYMSWLKKNNPEKYELMKNKLVEKKQEWKAQKAKYISSKYGDNKKSS